MLILSMWASTSYAQEEQPAALPPATTQPTAPTPAAQTSAYDDLVELAEQLYQQRKYNEALQALDQAYKLNANPNLLYNRARILEEVGRLDDALADYEAFAIAPGVALEYRRETLERINVLKQTIAIKKQKEAPTKAPEAKVNSAPAPEAVSTRPVSSPPPKQANNAWKWLVGMGVVAGVAGGAFGGWAWNEQNAMTEATSLTSRRTIADSADQKALIADGLFITGGALTVIGLIIYAVTDDESSAPSTRTQSWKLVPNLSSQQATLGLQVTY